MNKKTEMAVYSRLGISSGAYETVIKAEEALVLYLEIYLMWNPAIKPGFYMLFNRKT